MTARVGVITFPGSLDDRDAARAVRLAGAEPVPLWHADADLHGVDAVVLPGGFSYGDYLRAGAIARFAPMMDRLVRPPATGLPVLGICNGFQVLCESHLLPGALMRNDEPPFVCRDQRLRIENAGTAWTGDYDGRPGDRRPDQEHRRRLHRRRRRPSTARGRGPGRRPLPGREPERLAHDIAGICNEARQRRRPHAAPRARRRGPDRPDHRRPRLLHLDPRKAGDRRGMRNRWSLHRRA